MTKKEINALKQEYKNAIFDTWYAFYKMSVTRTQENENSYNRRILIEIEVEKILKALGINLEKLLSEEEKDYIQNIAKEVATAIK